MPKSRSGLLVLLATLALGVTAQTASAAACIDGHPSVKDEYATAMFVAEVTVAEIGLYRPQPHPHNGATVWEDERRIRFKPIKAWKGDPGAEFTIRDRNTSARLPANPGDRYLLFVKTNKAGENFVDTCGNSGITADLAPEVLSQVKALAR
ncbi:MAG: hypothetical protein KF842_09790 [Caulobacter sp.]|nr:hypothetical protein [Caulobacter sp.]